MLMPDPKNLSLLAHWISEREMIRMKKQINAPRPWSDDKIMCEWRWCNVDRNDDRETRWIHKNLIKGAPTDWFNLVIARFINWSPTLTEIGYITEWSPTFFCRVIRSRMDRAEKVYTGAYMIRAGTGADALKSKELYLCDRVFTPLWERRDDCRHLSTCLGWQTFFSGTFGMGDFMMNQVITDVKYSHHCPRGLAQDWSTFCLCGPGTLRGLNRVFGRDKEAGWKSGEDHCHLLNLRDWLLADGLEGTRIGKCFDDLNNVANCLCEFDKYMRLLNSEGEPRSKYKPSNNPLP